MSKTLRSRSSGFSTIELGVTIGLATIMMAISTTNLRSIHNSAQSAAFELTSFIKKARAEAMATTRAARILTDGNNNWRVAFARSCNATYPGPDWVTDASFVLTTKDGATTDRVTVSTTTVYGTSQLSSWNGLCFSARGFSTDNAVVKLVDGEKEFGVEVMLGGSIQVKR